MKQRVPSLKSASLTFTNSVTNFIAPSSRSEYEYTLGRSLYSHHLCRMRSSNPAWIYSPAILASTHGAFRFRDYPYTRTALQGNCAVTLPTRYTGTRYLVGAYYLPGCIPRSYCRIESNRINRIIESNRIKCSPKRHLLVGLQVPRVRVRVHMYLYLSVC